MTTQKSTLMMLLLQNIIVGKSNPRKAFDEDGELVNSIKEKGVIQPILVRPAAKEGTYELVCGERRYRASQIAGLIEIPSYIRSLTDDEALELQITENLQRKDVHPMEEAWAFKQLMERRTMEEVSARVGKKDYFVKQRMKLNDLTPEWQKLFYRNIITTTDALKLALMNAQHQGDILKDKGIDKKNVDKTTKVHITESDINQYKGQLSKANFDLTDATIDKKAGACVSCQFNSAVANLFPDSVKNPICSNISCYKRKSDIAFDLELKKAFEDPAIIFISNNWRIDDEKIEARLKKENHSIITSSGYSEIGLQEADVKDYEEWEEEEWFEDDETEEEKAKKYQEYLDDCEKDKAATEKKIAAGKYIKALIVDGTGKGKYKYVELIKQSADKVSKKAVETGEPTAADIDAEIIRIRDRQKRNKELDAEKVHRRIVEDLKKDKAMHELPEKFTDADQAIMMLLVIQNISYGSSRDKIKKLTGVTSDYDMRDPQKTWELIYTLSPEKIAFIARRILLDKFENSLPTNNGGFFLRKLAEVLGTIPIEAYETEQKEKAEKRQKNVDKRILELQEQKKLLKPKKDKKKATA